MAQNSSTPEEFVRSVFSPIVAVMSSPTVEAVVQKNNLNFVELLQPYTQLNSEANIRDPGSTPFTVKGLRLLVKDVNRKPPPPHLARKVLNDVVSNEYCEDTRLLQSGSKQLNIPSRTPWFERWRDVYMESQYPLEHDFVSHIVSCILVATSRDEVVTVLAASVRTLAAMQATPVPWPRFFNSNVLRTYVLLHDYSDGPVEKAERMFESMKQTYGAGNCFMLCINSGSQGGDHKLPDIWTPLIGSKLHVSSQNSGQRTPVDVATEATAVETDPSEESVSPGESESVHPLSASATFEGGFDSGNTLQESPVVESASYESALSAAKRDGSTSVRGTSLSPSDRDNVSTFVHNYVYNALLPYIERQIAQLSEAVANKKGVSRSLLSATKRWFGTNKPGGGPTPNTVIYTADCPEMQQRRLGDAWFLIGAWQRAFAHYHAAKRELLADGATSYYASALTMAALSAAMIGDTANTVRYFQQAHTTFLNTCRLTESAVRVTLLAAATIGQRGEAASYLIRMTAEDADLRSALLLEQAALCFVPFTGGATLVRKYAFHMVLAGHRYSKAGHKHHAYRCYNHSWEVYGSTNWRCAGEHVCAALGRLALATQRPQAAAEHLSRTLTPYSPHPAPHHMALLREYLLARQLEDAQREDRASLLTLPLPKLIGGVTQVACDGPAAVQRPAWVHPTPADQTAKLEEMSLLAAEKPNAAFAKPTITRFNENTDNTQQPKVPQGEPVRITITLENPIKVQLKLTNLQLLWSFTAPGQATVHNEGSLSSGAPLPSGLVASSPATPLQIGAQSTVNVNITVTPLAVGDLVIKGVAYKLQYTTETGEDSESSIVGKQMFEIRGPRLNKTKDYPKDQYAPDRRLEIKVTEPAPCLQVSLSETDPWACEGELRVVQLELLNAGPEALSSLSLAFSDPATLALASDTKPLQDLYEEKFKPEPVYEDERQRRAFARSAAVRRHVRSLKSTLAPGANSRAIVYMRPRKETPNPTLLAYYERPNSREHRVLSHQWNVQAQEVVSLNVTSRRGLKYNASSESCSESLTLAVQVKNVTKSETERSIDIRVIHVALVGKQWKLRSKLDIPKQDLTLKGQEELSIVVQADRLGADDLPEEEIQHSGIVLDPIQPEASYGVDREPYCRFVTDFPALDDVESASRARTPGAVDSALVIRWRADIHSADGNVRSVIGQTSKWISGGDPPVILCRAIAPQLLRHDFPSRRLAVVPIQLHIVNCCDHDVEAHLDSNDKGCVGAWAGRRIHLSSRGTTSICVKMCVSSGAPIAMPVAPARVSVASPRITSVTPRATLTIAAA